MLASLQVKHAPCPMQSAKRLTLLANQWSRCLSTGTTVPHQVVGRHSAARVLLKPASPGTGVIAGGGVRAVVEAAGYKDILSKSLGSQNALNVMMATMDGLRQLKHAKDVAADRDKPVAEVVPFWSRG